MSIQLAMPTLDDSKLYPLLIELLRRSADVTVAPIVITPAMSPPQVVIGGTTARMSVPLSIVVDAAFDNVTTFYNHLRLQRSLSVSADAQVSGILSAGVVWAVRLRLSPPPVAANNAAALAAGLSAGDIYRTGADPDTLAIVH